MAKREVCYTDTGEVLEKGPKFVMMAVEDLILCNKNLTAADFNVMGYLVANASRYGFINHTQAMIADSIGLVKSAVSRSFKHLMAEGYINWVIQNGRQVIRLNPLRISKRGAADFKGDLV